MNVNTKKHISRRMMVRGLGVGLTLPFLDAMLPAQTPLHKTAAASPARLVCFEMVHGSAGSSAWGIEQNLWAPAAQGRNFDLSPSSLSPLEPFRDYLTIVSNTDVRMAEAAEPREVGGDHYRGSAVFLTQSHPRRTEGSDVVCGISIDQLYAQKYGQDTPIPSIQLSIESVDQSGGCSYGYSCVYMDSISWASANEPLPMVRNPRAVFDQLFGDGSTAQMRSDRLRADRSILDWIVRDVALLKRDLGPADRRRLDEHLEKLREVERRIQRVEAYNSTAEARELPEAPVGVPDAYEEHLNLMLDLQVLALSAGITRVSTLKMSRDVSARVWPASGVRTGFHNSSHYGTKPDAITEFSKINKYHIGLLPYFLEKLRSTPDGDGNLLDHTLFIYGSAMGDSNLHGHRRCPLFLAGHANGQLKGNLHVKAANDSPMANVYLTLLHRLGFDNLAAFGDSTGEVAI